MNEWIAAGIALAAGIIGGTVLGSLTRSMLSKERRPESLRSIAAPLGSLVFSVALIAGLMTALGFVNKEALDQIPDDLVDYLPKVLSAIIVIVGANVAAQLVAAALERAVSRMPASMATVPRIARLVIMVFGVILAAAQLGVDTTIINIAVSAVLFSLGLATALMIGLGSRHVTSEVAAGRAVRRLVKIGDTVEVGGVRGEVVGVQSVALELKTNENTVVLVPHGQFLDSQVVVQRASAPPAAD